MGLQRFPFIWDHRAIPHERKTSQIPVLAHVLVGEPASTSPGHALRDGTIGSDGLDAFRLGYAFVRDEIADAPREPATARRPR
jgi:hypothetical protein